MQKKNWALVVGLLFVFASTLAFAQGPGTYTLGGFGGLCLPQGPDDFKDYYKSGIGFGAEFKYNINEKMSFVGSFAYLPFKFNEDKMEEDIIEEVGEEDLEVTIEGGGVKVNAIQADCFILFLNPKLPRAYTFSVEVATI